MITAYWDALVPRIHQGGLLVVHRAAVREGSTVPQAAEQATDTDGPNGPKGPLEYPEHDERVDALVLEVAGRVDTGPQEVAPAVAGGMAVGQPQQPPPQQPPPVPPSPLGAGAAVPPTATVDSSFTVSSWPAGHVAGAEDSAIGRLSSNVSPQLRHRYS